MYNTYNLKGVSMSESTNLNEKATKLGKKKPKPGSGKRFDDLVKQLKKKKAVENPEALAAWIGRKKYGKGEFQSMALSAKNKKEDIDIISQLINDVCEGADPEVLLDELLSSKKEASEDADISGTK